jgi:hypothetical protein
VERQDFLDGLEFDDQTIVNQEVETKRFFKDEALVFDGDEQFILSGNIAQLTFPATIVRSLRDAAARLNRGNKRPQRSFEQKAAKIAKSLGSTLFFSVSNCSR